MSLPIPQCLDCRHLKPGGSRCSAFPTGIPDAIWLNQHDHKKPFPGDNGVQFEPTSAHPISTAIGAAPQTLQIQGED